MLRAEGGSSTPPRLRERGLLGLGSRRGKIATVLAQARASVQLAEENGGGPADLEDAAAGHRAVGTLDEPSRPFTPASMDSRINNIESRIFGRLPVSAKNGGLSRSNFNINALDDYTKQNLTKSKERRKMNEMQKGPDISLSQSAEAQDARPFSSSGISSSASREGSRNGSAEGSVRASTELLRDEFADVTASVQKHLSAAKKYLASAESPYDSPLLHELEHLYDATGRLAKITKKCPEIVFGDPAQCIRGLLEWLSEAHNASSGEPSSAHPEDEELVDLIRHVYCKCILRLHLSIFSVTASAAVVDTMVIVLKEIYLYFKSRHNADESLIDLSIVELLLDVMRLTWTSVDKYLIEKGYSASMEAVEARGSRQRKTLSAFEMELATDTIVKMTQCSEISASCIKMYTANKQNRRKLLRLDAMSVLILGLRKFIGLGTFWGSVDTTPPETVFSGMMGRLAAASLTPSADSILTSEKLRDQLCAQMQSVVEALTIIRNLSLDEDGRSQIHGTGTLSLICKLIQVCTSQPFSNLEKEEEILGSVSGVLLSAVRVTSKLSLYEDLRDQLNKSKPPLDLAAIAGVIGRESKQCLRVLDGQKGVAWPSWHTWSLLSRAAFTLGNFTTSNEYARFFIGIQCGCTQDLMILLRFCVQSLEVINAGAESCTEEFGDLGARASVDADDGYFPDDPDVSREGTGGAGTASAARETELADATLKMTRLIANISIHQSAGSQLASRLEVLEYIYDLVNVAVSQPEYEELLLNAVATATNIGFYACKEVEATPNPKLQSMLINIAMQLANLLFHENTELVGESLRALGNLSRMECVVQRLCAMRGDETIILLLAHRSKELAQAAAGVMVNISGHAAFFDSKMESHFSPDVDYCEDDRLCKLSVNKITSLLRKCSIKEYTYMTLLLQVFYNCLNRMEKPRLTKSLACFGATIEDICELVPSTPHLGADAVSTATSRSERQLNDFRTAAKLVLRALRDLRSL